MPDPETEAELLDDRTAVLAPRAAGTPARSLPGALWRWLPIAVVGALAGGLVILDRPPAGLVGPTSPGAVTPQPPAAVASQRVAPTDDPGPCGTGRVAISPALEPPNQPAIEPVRVPPGGLLASAIETSPTEGSIVVLGAQPDGGYSSRLVATFAGRDTQGPFGVTVVGWSAAGDQFLVRAAHQGMASGDSSCANLSMVYADGSGVRDLTNNGPGDAIDAPVLAPRSRQVAFVQDDDLRVTDTEAPNGTGKVGDCPSPWSVRWAPDERRLLAICAGGQILVIAGAGETTRSLPVDTIVPVLAAWSPDSSSITVVAARGDSEIGPLTVFDVDPTTGIRTHRLDTDTSTEWAPSRVISPSGEWLLIEGRLLGSNDFPFFAVNLRTGVTKRLPWPVFSGVVGQESFAWLPDGDSMLYGDDGTLYVLNFRELSRTAVGSVPAPDFAWLNRAP